MYTEGIRKLFDPRNSSNIKQAANATIIAGYDLLLWNGIIYIVLNNKETISTTLTIDDFKVNFGGNI